MAGNNKWSWLMKIVDDENKKLLPVLGQCITGRMEIRVFLMEKYIQAMKSSAEFDNDVYCKLKHILQWRMYSAAAHKGEDQEKIKREMAVAIMLDRIVHGLPIE